MKNKTVSAIFLVVCLVSSMLLPPGYAESADSRSLFEPESKSPGICTDEQKNNEVNEETSLTLTEILARDTHIFDYADIESFERNNHTARIEELEDLNTYFFVNEDGTNTIYMMPENVKFKAEDGQIREKNTALLKTENGYITSENNIGLTIPENIKDGIKIKYEEKEINIYPRTEKNVIGEFNKNDNKIRYEKIFGEYADLIYTPTLSGVKEEIILSEYTGTNEFEFEAETNLNIYKDEKGLFFAESEDDEIKIYTGEILVYDAVGNTSRGEIKKEKTENGYLLTVTANRDFLENAVYPVTVDPTFTISENTGGTFIQDATLYQMCSGANFGYDTLNVIGQTTAQTGLARTAINLYGLETNEIFRGIRYSDIVSVKLNMSYSTGSTSSAVNMYRIMGNPTWSEYTVNWNNVGSYDSVVCCSGSFSNGTSVSVDITSIATIWKGMGASKYSLICLMSGTETDNYVKSCSSDNTDTTKRPYLEITYNGGITLSETSLELEEEQATEITATFSIVPGAVVTWYGACNSFSLTPDEDDGNTVLVEGLKAGTGAVTAVYIDSNGTVHYQSCSVIVTKPDGVYDICNVNSGYYMSKESRVTGTADVYQYGLYQTSVDEVTKLRQMWKVQYAGNGYYVIRPMHKPDMAMCYDEGNVAVTYFGETNANLTDDFKWKITWDGTGYRFTNKGLSSRTAQIIEASTGTNRSVIAGTYSSAVKTKCEWNMTAPANVSTIPAGLYFYSLQTGYEVSNLSFWIAPDEEKTLADLGIGVAAYSESTNSQSVSWYTGATGIAETVYGTGTVTGVSHGTGTVTASKYFTELGDYAELEYTINVTYLANGTYFLKNRENSDYAKVKNAVASENQEVVQYDFDGEVFQKWIFTHLGDGYYSVRTGGSETAYYLGILNNSTSQNATAVIGTGQITGSRKWKVEPTQGGGYKLIPRTGESSGYCLCAGTSAGTNDTTLVQNAYAQNTMYTDEWIICSFDYSVLLAINDDGIVRNTYFTQTKHNLEQEKESMVSIVSTHCYSSCSEENMINYMQSNDILFIHTHGLKNGFKISTSSYKKYLYMSDLNGVNLSNLKLAVLLTCNTGEDFNQTHITSNTPVNIVEKMVVCGAETVVGFKELTYVSDCNIFAEDLTENLVQNGMTIENAINSINYNQYEKDMSEIVTIGGNTNLVIR